MIVFAFSKIYLEICEKVSTMHLKIRPYGFCKHSLKIEFDGKVSSWVTDSLLINKPLCKAVSFCWEDHNVAIIYCKSCISIMLISWFYKLLSVGSIKNQCISVSMIHNFQTNNFKIQQSVSCMIHKIKIMIFLVITTWYHIAKS